MIIEIMLVMLLMAIAYTLMFQYPIVMVVVCGVVLAIAAEEYIRKGRFKNATLGTQRWFFVPGRGFRKMIVVRDGRNLYWYDGRFVVRQNKVNGFMLWKSKQEWRDKMWDKMIWKKDYNIKDAVYLCLHERDVIEMRRD